MYLDSPVLYKHRQIVIDSFGVHFQLFCKSHYSRRILTTIDPDSSSSIPHELKPRFRSRNKP